MARKIYHKYGEGYGSVLLTVKGRIVVVRGDRCGGGCESLETGMHLAIAEGERVIGKEGWMSESRPSTLEHDQDDFFEKLLGRQVEHAVDGPVQHRLLLGDVCMYAYVCVCMCVCVLRTDLVAEHEDNRRVRQFVQISCTQTSSVARTAGRTRLTRGHHIHRRIHSQLITYIHTCQHTSYMHMRTYANTNHTHTHSHTK